MLNRRSFLRKSIRWGLLVGAGPLFVPGIRLRAFAADAAKHEAASSRSTLSVGEGDPAAAVKKAVDLLGGMGKYVESGNRVLLKPNVGFPNPPQWATTTHPVVVEAVARLCLEAGADRVLIMDHPVRQATISFEKSGIGAIGGTSKRISVIPLDQKRFFRNVSVKGGKELKETDVALEALSTDVIINLPILKSHSATRVSGSLKNLLGLVWDRGVFHRKMDLDQAIVDLNTLIRPRLTILDGTRILVTRGPGGPGKVVEAGFVVAGEDPLAVDAFAVRRVSWDGEKLKPEDIPHLAKAWRGKLGNIEAERFDLKV